MPNPNQPADLAGLQLLVPAAITVAREHLTKKLADWEERIEAPLRAYRERLDRWEQASLFEDSAPASLRAHRDRRVRDTAAEQRSLVDLLETSGDPLLRVLAVLDGGGR